MKSGHGGYLDHRNWRAREWTPGLNAAGISHRTPYALHHTFATNALRARLNIFELARYMGTSVAMIDRACGHLTRGEGLFGAGRRCFERPLQRLSAARGWRGGWLGRAGGRA